MKAIILAAGFGSRLGLGIPKALTEIDNKKTIMDYQLENIKDIIGLDNIIVVVGYQKELIIERYPQLTYIYNKDFASTGTAKSLLCALEEIDEDVLFLNGDVYFEGKVISRLIDNNRTSFLVDKSQVGDEEIKYTLNEKGYIYELSKQVKNALGEAVGINFICREDINNIKAQLREVDSNEYFEKAFENLALSGQIEIVAVDREDNYVKEIDFLQDLEEVRNYKS